MLNVQMESLKSWVCSFLKENELAIIAKQNNPGKGEREMTMTKDEKKEMIDGLLDLYNDYCKLYEHFGDDEYRHIMKDRPC